MTVFSNILVILALLYMVTAVVASAAVLSIPSQFLKSRATYVALSLLVPFFGLLVIVKNGKYLPKLNTAFLDRDAQALKTKTE